MSSGRISVAVVLLCQLFSARAFAEGPSPGQEPGAQADRYRRDVGKEKRYLEHKEKKPAEIKTEEKGAAAVSAGPAFTLKDILVTGSTVFSPVDFKDAYAPYIGKEVAFKDIQGVCDKIDAKYKERGYFTATVYIPEQEIKGGMIEIRIAEGRVGGLNIEGNKWFSSSFIERFIHLEKDGLLNMKSLARDILRLNKNPDLEVKAVLSRGARPQTSDITLKVEDKFPWHAGFLQDNRGSRLTGKYRSMAYLRSSNLSGSGDSLFVSSLYSGRTFGEAVSYTRPIGTNGTRFGLDVTYFKMSLGKEFKAYEYTGNSQVYTPYVTWELALSEAFEAYADLGMDIKSVKKKLDGDTIANDQLRTPFFGFDLIGSGPGSRTEFAPKFNFGTSSFLGSSSVNHPTSSRAGTGGSFFKYEQTLSRMQRMFFDSYIFAFTQLQLASHTLASSEQLQLGGADSVRGYPEGDYLADAGGLVRLEWFFPSYFIPKDWKLKGQELPLRYQIEPVIFVDAGGGKLKKTLPGEEEDKFLTGVGGGLRFYFKQWSLRLDWAKAVGDDQTSGSGPSTFYFTFQSEI